MDLFETCSKVVSIFVGIITMIISWNICPTPDADITGHLATLGVLVAGGWLLIYICVSVVVMVILGMILYPITLYIDCRNKR